MGSRLQLGGDRGIEIGGTKGKVLTNSIRQTHSDFLAAIQVFVHAEYNIMDVDSKAFDEDFYLFRSQINELERRLASVITQAFDDAVTVFGRFKLLDSFEGLLEREIIQTDLEKKNIDLLNGYAADLKQVQEIFVVFKDQPPINYNAPPRAGAVAWVRGLMERIQVIHNILISFSFLFRFAFFFGVPHMLNKFPHRSLWRDSSKWVCVITTHSIKIENYSIKIENFICMSN